MNRTLNRPPSMLLSLPPGREGVMMTLRMMRTLALGHQGKVSSAVRQAALAAVRREMAKDYWGEVVALQRWVRDRIRYVRDARDVETVQTPERTLINGQGDCDDQATLLAAMLETIGNQVRFQAMGWAPGALSHVMAQVRTPAGWVPLETTRKVEAGWYPPNVVDTLELEL